MSTPETANAAAGGDAGRRPRVLIVSHTLMGHLAPMLRIAAALCAQGWPVAFLGPTAHRARIEASGADFLPLHSGADLDDREYYANPPFPGGKAAYDARPWHERVLIDLERQCIEPLPAQWACLRGALAQLRTRDPPRPVLVLAEAFFLGALPLRYGAPLDDNDNNNNNDARTPRPRSLCVSVTVPALRSRDLPPMGYPFPFDASPDGRTRNARLWDRSWAARRAAPLTALLAEKMREVGAVDWPAGEVLLAGANYLCHERILQLGVPSFEYPRSDWPPQFRFAGLVQGRALPPPVSAQGTANNDSTATKKKEQKDPDFPWWPELVANSALHRDDPRRKKVVVVTQGTVEINPEDLILPTIRAFAPPSPPSPASLPSFADNILVIAILGWKDARLTTTATEGEKAEAKEFPLPSNARVADYLSYDAALVHADVWVHNAGYGAVCHGLAHGVPMVVAGEGMDKGDNARRVAWAGAGVDLGCVRPSADAMRAAVESVLIDEGGTFAERVRALKQESEALDCFTIVHEELSRLASVDIDGN